MEFLFHLMNKEFKMLKYAKVIDDETKLCEVGLGNPDAIYKIENKTKYTTEYKEQEQVIPAEYDIEGNLIKEETTEIIQVPVTKEETYQEIITVGDWYNTIGMTEKEVEKAYNGKWYLAGYAPSQPLDELKEQKRTERDNLLQSTDKFMLSDYPITEEEKVLWIKYRKYLRDLPEGSDFPNVEVLTFEDWNK